MDADQKEAAAALATLILLIAFALGLLAVLAGIWVGDPRFFWTAGVFVCIALLLAYIAARLRGAI